MSVHIGYVYWSDVFSKSVHRMTYNGSWYETVIEGEPEGLAIDWISRNIYWTQNSGDEDSIQVARLDSRNSKTLIKDGLVDPRGIVVHPGLGRLYWTDWNRFSPKIETANMDGTERGTFVSENLVLPNMLAIDYASNDLCWTDAGSHRIECVSLNGQNRRIIHTPAAYPFDITVASDYIFYTDWQE